MTTEQVKPRPMSEAPRDGTVILVFCLTVSYPYPMAWGGPSEFIEHEDDDTLTEGWRMTWDDAEFLDHELLGWLPCPTYTGEAVK